jgi:hypothetical protein
MKKVIFTTILSLCMLSGFAKTIYKGDVQLQLGYSANSIRYEDNSPNFDTNNFNLGVQTWHLFGSSEFFKAGFMVNNEWGFGNSEINQVINEQHFVFNTYSLIGPAIGMDFAGFVRLNFAVGFATIGNIANYDNYTIANMNCGFGLDVQAKLLPRFSISPIIGYRFASTFGNSASIVIDNSSNVDFLFNEKQTPTLKNEIYTGVSFNW